MRAFGRFGGKWWLRKLGGLLQRGQGVGMLALVRVAAAAVAGIVTLATNGAETRFRDLGGCAQPVLAAHALATVARLAIGLC